MNEPDWLTHARTYIGVAEIPGKQTAPTIARWLLELQSWWRDDETPWCGTFVAAVLRESGVPIAPHWYRARAWLEWGVTLNAPRLGCVAVFERGGGGHVGFVVGQDRRGYLMVLGGNQGNRVSVAPFDWIRVLGYRWPTDRFAELAETPPLPILAGSGVLSQGEQ